MKRHMKKFCILLCVLTAFILCACGGNVKTVRMESVESDLYSQADIASAVKVIVDEFDRSWTGCTLTSIAYAGDERTLAESKYYLETAALYDADELIVLISSFDVDSRGGNGSLTPDSTYDDYCWILVRNHGGAWKHVDHGYG